MLTLKAKGLHTFENPNVATPDGALAIAQNVSIDRPDTIEPRRGLSPLAVTFVPSNQQANACTFFQSMLFGHLTDNSITWWDPSNPSVQWQALSGSYPAITGQAMRFAQANQSLFFATSGGVYKLDSRNGTPGLAGVVKGVASTSAQTGLTGFQVANSQVAYRDVWGVKDANSVVSLGVPSSRCIQSGEANAVPVAIGGLVRAGAVVTVTSAAHGYVNGDVVYLASTESNFPSGNQTVGAATANTFTYGQAGNATASTIATSLYYASRNVSRVINFPPGVTVNNFVQVYRTAGSPDASIDPGDEMGMVYEYVPTAADIATGSVTFTDIVPDSMRGATLYTSESREGLVNGNERPPLAYDLAPFKGSMFYARTTGLQRLTLSLLAIGGAAGMAINDAIVFYDSASSTTFSLGARATETIASGLFKLYTAGSVAQNIADTAASIVRVANGYTANTFLSAYYGSGPNDVPGKMLFEARTPGANAFACRSSVVGCTYFSPILPYTALVVSTLARVANIVTCTTATPHLFSVGQQVFLYDAGTPSTNFTVGPKLVKSTPTGATFTYSEVGSTVSDSSGTYLVLSSTNSVSTADSFKNSLFFSKPGQPDAVPLLNNVRVGSGDFEILRIVPLRDSLFIFKTDGLYRLTGTDPSSFRVDLFDSTVILAGPQTAVPMANQVFCFTTQGVAAISDSGAQIISKAIEGELLGLLTLNPGTFRAYAFGVAYESEHKYLLWTIAPDDANNPRQAYVYNLHTDAWTLWTMPAICGAVGPADDLLYVADLTQSTFRQERKSRTYQDFTDGTVAVTITAHSGSTVTVASVAGLTVGDLLYQGGVKSIITLIKTLDLTLADSGLAWSNAAATVYIGISTQVQWTANELGDPAGLKQAYEASFLFNDARFSTATIDFGTDLQPGADHVSVAGTSALGGTAQTFPLRVRVPQEHQVGVEFYPGFTVRNAWGTFQLCGLSLLFNVLSDTTVR